MGLSGLRGLGGIMAGFTHRLKNILQSLKAPGPGPSSGRLAALQELAEDFLPFGCYSLFAHLLLK